MRLSFLSAFPPYRGGIAQFSTSLVLELRKEHDVLAFTFTCQYPDLLFPGTSQYDTDSSDGIGAVRVLNSVNPRSWQRTAQRMLEAKPDVAVLRYWMPFFAPAMGTVAATLRKNGVKVITIVDNALPHEPHFYDRSLTRWFLRRNDGFIAMTEAVAEDLRTLCPSANVKLMPHPLYDHFGAPLPQGEARRKLGLPVEARVLLFFGLIRDYKGLDLLIEAFGKLDERYHLVVAGEPYGDFGEYKRLIEASPKRGHIHLHARFIAEGEVPAFFSAADAVVLPYRSATQSGITAIAYHFGVPVIATDVGGLKEALYDGRAGIVVPEVSASAIAAGVKEFFARDPSTLRTNIAALRDELSWKRFAKGLVEFTEGL
ncbi:MAG: glycosyltransferase [Flavobacteriales bacterium]|jgi:glycosyltransferase involved in cell wall biosynthesis|nr:glycosyltransferase [Flavobacteriales bacterium]MBK9060270.1 glycosyltransferase [Flavobacteriales bacterium]MBK9598950.1 glycosyltransferase [Flavobacteriales bacterium]QQS73155.1 MAG: glycosyltransferase [Flavobacteriales bacterium]HQV39372.1 glycosyltransferase [Flavobacteriales bacterium]